MSRTFKTDPYAVRVEREGYMLYVDRLGEYFPHLPEYLGYPWPEQDREHMRQERKRQRHQDNHLIRTTADWDAYSHPRHPFDAYTLPSW